MDTVLIGIHGLRNKPPRYILAGWWKKAIAEGFETMRLPAPKLKFEMAYWAHYMHEKSQNPMIKDPEHPQYLWEPYHPCSRTGPREPHPFRKKLRDGLHQQILELIAGKSGFMNVETVSDIILRRMFIELDVYYHKKLKDGYGRRRPARELIRGELERVIRKHRKKNICILAHSMGTIIAYDVLLHAVEDIPVNTLVTFGAPLGFPVIMKKIRQELGADAPDGDMLPTPSCIQHKWLNISDPDDVTCLNYNLRNHYRENGHGVRPFDQIVYNNYEYNGIGNPHKAYGYLCTAEITQALNYLYVWESAGVWERIKWVFKKPRL